MNSLDNPLLEIDRLKAERDEWKEKSKNFNPFPLQSSQLTAMIFENFQIHR